MSRSASVALPVRMAAMLLFVAPAGAVAGGTGGLDSLIQAEEAFARSSLERGMRRAFLDFLADEAVLFRPRPVDGRRWFSEREESSGRLSWRPALAGISAAGDLGFTSGPWEWRDPPDAGAPSARGHFVSVWRREPNGDWKVVADIGTSDDGEPAGRPASVERIRPRARHAVGRDLDPAVLGEDLLEADRGLSARVAASGAVAALRSASVRGVRLYRNGADPRKGRDAWRLVLGRRQGRLTWRPIGAGVSRSGDLGYTYGSAFFEPAGGLPAEESSYLRVWRRDRRGSWALQIDVRIPVPPG